jgi:transcriptional regulator with XRE-family HTH domain
MPSRRVPDPFAAQIGDRIRQLRKEKHMTLVELARASHISRGHLSEIEQGKVVMTVGTLGNIAAALDLPVFVLCLVPKDDSGAVIDEVLLRSGGNVKSTAVQIRAAALEADERDPPKGQVPDK